ncbi:MAG TPA: 2Fe-2S iron-sulfur cluster-binding protein [Steroidobacteraceae bacterium]
MTGPHRITAGLLTDAAKAIGFSFDGRTLTGLAGDTLASALLANGVRLVGRSFKYHRPRGVVTVGPDEPCALVDVLTKSGREPNQLATTLELATGLAAESQNRWPSLGFDMFAINDRLSRFLPAGFYYKTFMAPGWAWERLYEPLIRRAAGLGRLQAAISDHAAPAETLHEHTDVLVVGAGTTGLAAAALLGASGLRVLLVDQDVALGGGSLLDARWTSWREAMLATLAKLDSVCCLPRTAVVGAYGHGVFGAVESLAPHRIAASGGLRERMRIIRARRVIFATGSVERLIAFPGNDVPGVMLASAALGYLHRYGVAVAHHPALFLNNDEAYEAAFALADAGVRCAGIIDVRPASKAADRARARGIEVHGNAVVAGVTGRRCVRALQVTDADGRNRRTIAADCLLMSGGYSPASALASQLGAALVWQSAIAAFTPALDSASGYVAGAARGCFGLAAAAQDGASAAVAIARDLGRILRISAPAPDLPVDPQGTSTSAVWEIRGRGKAFVDLQHDVTADDVRLAQREGYEHVEHMKRYTTHGMATDQGRIGGLVGSAVLAAARGVPLSRVGQPHPRPYLQPLSFAALAGMEVREHFKPKRRLPLHQWHESAGATFVPVGVWLRPLVYSKQTGWDPVLKEARAVRHSVGVTDVSTLGKIDVQGADAGRFLDFVYANSMSTLAVGRARYGIMLREDGMMLDDGTVSRFGPEHFLLTTTTANSAAILEHLEFQLQANCPTLDVLLTDVGDQWAQFALAGPRSREVLAAVVSGIDVANEAFPFMATAEANIAGRTGRLFRISFSGELAYELAVPASEAQSVWLAVLEAGKTFDIKPYGLDALNTLRIEKGHVTGAELNGNTSADDLGMQRMLKKQGDFVGRMLSQRSGLSAPDRLQLVGVRPADAARRLRNGAHVTLRETDTASLGYITSSTPTVEREGWVGLALVAGGRARIGQRLFARSVIHGESLPIDIVSAHMLDPENLRVRA